MGNSREVAKDTTTLSKVSTLMQLNNIPKKPEQNYLEPNPPKK